MSEYQIRIAIQVRDLSTPERRHPDRPRPLDWRDDYVRLNVTAETPDDAVRLVQKELARLVERESQRRISVVDAGERPVTERLPGERPSVRPGK